jgi:pilus assembly protein CpaC
VAQIPALGNVPILGALFRSARWQRNETELLIIVTPRMVEAADFQRAATQHDPEGGEPTAAELFLKGTDMTKPFPGEAPVARP